MSVYRCRGPAKVCETPPRVITPSGDIGRRTPDGVKGHTMSIVRSPSLPSEGEFFGFPLGLKLPNGGLEIYGDDCLVPRLACVPFLFSGLSHRSLLGLSTLLRGHSLQPRYGGDPLSYHFQRLLGMLVHLVFESRLSRWGLKFSLRASADNEVPLRSHWQWISHTLSARPTLVESPRIPRPFRIRWQDHRGPKNLQADVSAEFLLAPWARRPTSRSRPDPARKRLLIVEQLKTRLLSNGRRLAKRQWMLSCLKMRPALNGRGSLIGRGGYY
jgi:hypothetical protein